MSKVIQKFFIFLAIVFVTFQPILVPAVYAVESWSGDSWEGNSWEGNPWNSSELQWSGEIWEGKSTNGEYWNGEGTNGNGFQGEYFNGAYWTSIPWYLEGWNAKGWKQASFNGSGSQGTPWTNPAINGYGSTQGTPWQANGFNGGLTQGNPYAQAGFDGLGTQGDPYAQPGFVGNGTQGAPYAQPGLGLYGYGTGDSGSMSPLFYGPFSTIGGVETSDPMDAKLPFEYDAAKFVVNGVILGQAEMMNNLATYENGSISARPTPGGFYKNVLINGVKLSAGDNAYVKGAANAYDSYTHAAEGIKAANIYRDVRAIRNASGGGLASQTRSLTSVSESALNISNGAVSKFNVAAAGIGAGFSAIETGFNTAKAINVYNSDASASEKVTATADATASLGDTIMNAGIVATAIPGGQAVGLGMTAAGAAIWLGSKGVKLFSSNWKGSLGKTTREIGRKAKEGIGKAYNKVKGWFS